MTLPILDNSDLLSVQKPAQYLGGEIGSVVKEDNDVDLHFCLAFPDTYEVGMAHVGYQILYDLINRTPSIWAERAYVPLPDMEALLREKGIPLRSLEGKRALREFHVVGFSLQYELCMNGILSMLDLGGIPLLQKERESVHPLVIGGGPVAYHPEPFADFFDAFLVGDGEELVPEFNEVVRQAVLEGVSRKELLNRIARIQGVYVPSFFQPLYNSDGQFQEMRPLQKSCERIERRIVSTLENAPYPRNPLVPNIKAVHDRLSVEVMRGCVRGCRFCQAGYLYRPQRERSPEEIRSIVGESLKNSGYEELSLLSLSTADYCSILPLLDILKKEFASEDKLAISFPSTRVDALKPELLHEVQSVRRSGFTMAPEAGTQRLRDVINKGVTDKEIIETCTNVFQLGWTGIKLYFMIGLPTETEEDILGIIDIARRVKALTKKGQKVTISVSTHVPKPHTPFQWARQISPGETVRIQQILYAGLKEVGVTFRYHDADSTFLEGVFARGDRRLGPVILRAYELGCRLDGWVEELNSNLWEQAFADIGIEPAPYLDERNTDSPLPWDHISSDIPKKYFLKEWERALKFRVTPDCLTQTCSICGACDYDATRNVLFDRERSESRLQIINPPWKSVIDAREARQQSEEKIPAPLLKDAPSISNLITPAPSSEATNGSYTLKEYLKTESDEGSPASKLPAQPVAQKLRCRYTKLQAHRFTAHLELIHIFFRAARRAEIPVAYSRGFNPRARMAFGPPLQLGIESSAEFVDISLTRELDRMDFMHRLNAELPGGIRILEALPHTEKMASIQSLVDRQAFEATIDPALLSAEERVQLEDAAAVWKEKTVTRKRKRKTTQAPLRDSVTALTVHDESVEFEIQYPIRGSTLKPFEVLEAATGLDPLLFRTRKTEVIFRDDA